MQLNIVEEGSVANINHCAMNDLPFFGGGQITCFPCINASKCLKKMRELRMKHTGNPTMTLSKETRFVPLFKETVLSRAKNLSA